MERRDEIAGLRDLLAAVVVLAVDDACRSPVWGTQNMQPEARDAIDFLFRTSCAGVEAYCDWLGIDTDQFRRNLVQMMENDTTRRFSTRERRAFMTNLTKWRLLGQSTWERGMPVTGPWEGQELDEPSQAEVELRGAMW